MHTTILTPAHIGWHTTTIDSIGQWSTCTPAIHRIHRWRSHGRCRYALSALAHQLRLMRLVRGRLLHFHKRGIHRVNLKLLFRTNLMIVLNHITNQSIHVINLHIWIHRIDRHIVHVWFRNRFFRADPNRHTKIRRTTNVINTIRVEIFIQERPRMRTPSHWLFAPHDQVALRRNHKRARIHTLNLAHLDILARVDQTRLPQRLFIAMSEAEIRAYTTRIHVAFGIDETGMKRAS
mmetsp:Transcript_32683/g.53024  ORF Transcript_32683/g.53024 Transcript_32683/m.53024 type:complete len:235 (-) Transcript_32683:1061-1765(-)